MGVIWKMNYNNEKNKIAEILTTNPVVFCKDSSIININAIKRNLNIDLLELVD